MGDRLVGDLPDLLDHPGGLLEVPLPVGDQHPLAGHHEHAHRGEELLAGGAELLVGIHPGCEFLNPGEVGLGEAALEGIGGADRNLGFRVWFRSRGRGRRSAGEEADREDRNKS